MPGINLTGSLIAGILLGGGLLWYIISRLGAAETQRARADSEASYIGGKLAADQTTQAAETASDDAKTNVGSNPLDW